MKYWEQDPPSHPQTVQYALIAAVRNFEKQREFALRHHEALQLASAMAALWHDPEQFDYSLSFPASGMLQGVLVTLHFDDQHGFRDMEPFLALALDAGWKAGDASDYPEIGRRSFQCVKRIGKTELAYLTISGFIEKSNETCKMVEDGVETKFKFVCEDAA